MKQKKAGEKVDVRAIKLPPDMDDIAKKEFRRVRAELVSVGYCAIDQPALMCYLYHFSLWCRAKTKLEEQGPVILTEKGQAQINPWHSILKQNSELVKKYIQELGFSPGSRKRIGIDLSEEPTDDELFD